MFEINNYVNYIFVIKKEVAVDVYFDEMGICTPKCIYFDLKPYVVDKILDAKKIASGIFYTDMRYKIVVCGQTRYLYRYKDFWYVVIN